MNLVICTKVDGVMVLIVDGDGANILKYKSLNKIFEKCIVHYINLQYSTFTGILLPYEVS